MIASKPSTRVCLRIESEEDKIPDEWNYVPTFVKKLASDLEDLSPPCDESSGHLGLASDVREQSFN